MGTLLRSREEIQQRSFILLVVSLLLDKVLRTPRHCLLGLEKETANVPSRISSHVGVVPDLGGNAYHDDQPVGGRVVELVGSHDHVLLLPQDDTQTVLLVAEISHDTSNDSVFGDQRVVVRVVVFASSKSPGRMFRQDVELERLSLWPVIVLHFILQLLSRRVPKRTR